MTQKLSPAMIIVAIVAAVVIIGGIYWRTLGGGKTSSEEAKWSKPLVMKGPLKMPVIPPPPGNLPH